MEIMIFCGGANAPLAQAVAAQVGVPLGRRSLGRFPDSELNIEIADSVRGHDIYIIQPTSPPVDEHLMELIFMADACHRAGAHRVTAIVPYFGYARQDRRGAGREAVGGRLACDLLAVSHICRVVAVDLHVPSIEGFMGVPLEHLTAVPILARAVQPLLEENSIVVSPDLGGVKLAQRYATVLGKPLAVVHKARLSGHEVEVHGIVGDVRGRAPVIVDDMVSTAGTVAAAADALIRAGAIPRILVVATHGLLVGEASERVAGIGPRRLIFSDSVLLGPQTDVRFQAASLAPLLADAIKRLHTGQSMRDLIVHV